MPGSHCTVQQRCPRATLGAGGTSIATAIPGVLTALSAETPLRQYGTRYRNRMQAFTLTCFVKPVGNRVFRRGGERKILR